MKFIIIGEGGIAFWVIDYLQNNPDCRVVGVVGGTETFSDAVKEEWPTISCIGPAHRDWKDWILSIPCDFLLSVINIRKIPPAVINHPAVAAINFHDAVLPANGGLFAPQNMLASGQTEFGVTWHIVDEDFDTGSIVEIERLTGAHNQIFLGIENQLRDAGQRSFKRLLRKCLEGELNLRIQNLEERTYFSRDFRPGGFLVHSLTPRSEVVHWLKSCSKPYERTPWHFPMVRIAGNWHLLLELHECDKSGVEKGISIARTWSCKSKQFVTFPADENRTPDTLTQSTKDAWANWVPGRMKAHFQALRNHTIIGKESPLEEEPDRIQIGSLTLPELVDLMLVFHCIEDVRISCDLVHSPFVPEKDATNFGQLLAGHTTVWFQADVSRSLDDNRLFLRNSLERALNAGPILRAPFLGDKQASWCVTLEESGRFFTELAFPNAEVKIGEWKEVAKSWIKLERCEWNDLPKLTSSEISKLLHMGNGSFSEAPEDFVNAIWRHAELNPDDTAMELSDGRGISYDLLSSLVRKQRKAWETEGRQIDGEIVALTLPANHQLLVVQLTILTFGGTFCSIHHQESMENIESVIKKTGSSWGVCSEDLLNIQIQEGFWSVPLECEGEMKIGEGPLQPSDPADVAAILLTSGTSGTPKAVQVLRSGLSNHLHHLSKYTQDILPHRTLVTSSPAFDGVFEDFFLTLSQGGTVVFKGLAAMSRTSSFDHELTSREISVLHLNTTFWSHWVNAETFSIGSQLKLVNVGGGRMEPKLVKRWFETCEKKGTSVMLINGYGPTETSVTCTGHLVKKSDALKGSIPIGKPQSGVLIRILDDTYGLAKQGDQGKIFVGGRGVAKGYCEDPDRTADSFKKLSSLRTNFGDESFDRFYNTGDYGYWDEEGLLMFVGRKDEQIKFRGNRIEMTYVEKSILAHPQVTHCFVFHQAEELAEQLIAVVAFAENRLSSGGLMNSLKSFVNEKIAKHHQPTIFIEITEVPLTHSGKPDRTRLRKEIIENDAIDLGVDIASSPDKEGIASILAATLGKNLDSLNLNLSFQDNGADSLLTMVAQSKIERAICRELPLGLLNVKRPIREVLSEIENGVAWSASPVQVVSDAGKDAPFILVGHNYFGDPNMRNLWPGLAKDFTILALMCDNRMQGWLRDNPNSGMESYAAEFVSSVSDAVGTAPVFGIGTSWSAWLVWHVCAQLCSAGTDVKGVLIGEPELYAIENDFVKDLRKSGISSEHQRPTQMERFERFLYDHSPKFSATLYRLLRAGVRAGMGFNPFISSSGKLAEMGDVQWIQFHLEDSDGRRHIGTLLKGVLAKQKLTQSYVEKADFPILLFHRSAFKSKFIFWSMLTRNSDHFNSRAVPVAHHSELMLSTEIIETWVRRFAEKHLA